MEKKLDSNYTRMLREFLNKSWRQHLTKHQLYGHLPPITKTIKVRRTRHAGHGWRSREEFISDVLLWTSSYGRAKVGWPARTYRQQLSEDMECSLEDLSEAMNDSEEWRERVRDIRACGTWWWRWWNTNREFSTIYLEKYCHRSLCYIVIYAFIQHHNDTIIKTHEGRKTQEDFFRKIFTSHFIARVRKVSTWEDAGDRT